MILGQVPTPRTEGAERRSGPLDASRQRLPGQMVVERLPHYGCLRDSPGSRLGTEAFSLLVGYRDLCSDHCAMISFPVRMM